MKKFIFFILVPVLAWSNTKSINEENVVTHIHYLYKNFKIKGDVVQVKGPQLHKKVKPGEDVPERFAFKKRMFEISLKEFEFERSLADSSFTAISNDGTGRGSAVFIGGDYILTNLHVWNREYKTNKCDQFKIKNTPTLGSKTFKCRKLVKCSKDLDYCLVEMNAGKDKKLSDFAKAPAINMLIHRTGIVRVIGNVKGNGFQASAGDGINKRWKKYMHQAPLFKGASGGPLFNNAGELIGLNYAETKILKGPKAYNFATPLKYILRDLKKTVSKDILDQLLLKD